MIVKIINGLALSVDSPIKNGFIYDRLVRLHKKNIDFEVWSLESYYSKLIKSIYKHIYNKSPENPKRIRFDIPEKQCFVRKNITIFDVVAMKLLPNRFYSKILPQFDRHSFNQDKEIIIHAHVVFPYGYIAYLLGKKYDVPYVVTAHGSDIHTTPWKNKVIKKYTLKTINAANKVIFVSHALLDSAVALGYSGENAVVISNGIDSRYFSPMIKEEALIKTGWKQTHKYVVGFVGNLIPVKRADKFADIFSQIQQRVNDVEFIVIGDGYLKESIHTDCQKHGLKVTFTGKISHDDVGCWMNLFDVMILPSRNEGWPCVVLEAYACGIPVVGSANGGITEALGGLCPAVPDGEGFEMRFAEAVCDVLTGKVTVDKEKLVSWALKHTWDECMKSEISVYHDIETSRDRLLIN